MLDEILVINGGSSTLKVSLFPKKMSSPIWEKKITWEDDFEKELEKALKELPKQKIQLIGHRVVHGGDAFTKITRITPAVKQKIRELFFIVPLHNPINLAGIETCERLFPQLPQYAVFDTAFHMTLKEEAYTYPISIKYQKAGVRRYGFHGISYAYCSKKAAQFLKRPLVELKMVICHLGAGASLCAVKEGKSIDTTMGMTPLEGLMMATRSGSIDPGALLYILKKNRKTPEDLEDELNHRSGLLGVSELSSDMRTLALAAVHGNAHANLARAIFIHRLRSCMGAMIASLGGLDVLVFTAGIGENDSQVREEACASFSYLGLEIDPSKNRSLSHEDREISSGRSSCKVLVIPTKEEWEIAQQCIAATN